MHSQWIIFVRVGCQSKARVCASNTRHTVKRETIGRWTLAGVCYGDTACVGVTFDTRALRTHDAGVAKPCTSALRRRDLTRRNGVSNLNRTHNLLLEVIFWLRPLQAVVPSAAACVNYFHVLSHALTADTGYSRNLADESVLADRS